MPYPFYLKTVLLSAPVFGGGWKGCHISSCFPLSVPTHKRKLGLFTSRDRDFLVGRTFRSKTTMVLGKKGHLVTQATHSNKHSVQLHFFSREESDAKKELVKVIQQISTKCSTSHPIILYYLLPV